MIEGKTKSESVYRAILLDSSTSLKDFATNRKMYWKKYIMNEYVEDDDNKSVTLGKIVETLLLEPHEFDNRFFMSSVMSAPTEKMLDFVHALYNCTLEATNEQGEVTKTFEEISREAHTIAGYSGKGTGSYESVIKKFVGSDNEIYYQELRQVKAKNLSVITTQDVTIAEKIVEQLKTSPVTAEIVNLVDGVDYTILNQLQVEKFEIDGHYFKAMLDKVVIRHSDKTIFPFDLKCTWNVEGFYTDYYLYRKAYIQACLYYKAIEAWKKENGYEDYMVEYLQFIVCDSGGWYSPLIYSLSHEDERDAYEGFEHKGKKYMGVKQAIEELNWAVTENRWDISKSNYEKNGAINIKD